VGLIGLELSQQEIADTDEVIVTLPAYLIGNALEAAYGDDD